MKVSDRNQFAWIINIFLFFFQTNKTKRKKSRRRIIIKRKIERKWMKEMWEPNCLVMVIDKDWKWWTKTICISFDTNEWAPFELRSIFRAFHYFFSFTLFFSFAGFLLISLCFLCMIFVFSVKINDGMISIKWKCLCVLYFFFWIIFMNEPRMRRIKATRQVDL